MLRSIFLLATASLSLVSGQLSRPSQDPFYVVPSNIGSYANGAVVAGRIRPVTTTANATNLKQAYQLMFKTTMRDGTADGTIATIWVPQTAATEPKIVAYQSPEDADNIDCATSWAFVKGSASNNSGAANIESPFVIPWAINNGYYVVSTDSLQSNSAWLVGLTEGQAVLDGIRATMNQYNLPAAQTKVGMYGYSGAAHSIVWAASLSTTSYGEGINIVGAAYGGTPVDLRSAYSLLNGKSMAILAGAAFIGLVDGYPGLGDYFRSVANPTYSTNYTAFRTPGYCPSNEAAAGNNVNYTAMFNTNVLAPGTPLSQVLANESLLSNVSSLPIPVPLFPRLEYHGDSDTTVPYAPEKQYVSQQCSKGANIQFVTYPGDHAAAAAAGLIPAFTFLDQAFNDTTPKVTCGFPTL